MNEIGYQKIYIDGDNLYRSTVLESYKDGHTLCKNELIMTKDIFVKCYNAWIKGTTEDEDITEDYALWIKNNIVLTSNPPQYSWYCSKCGNTVFGEDESVLTDICSDCGSKMKGED